MTTPQDFERLSAYLDNQLSLSEKAKLDARLSREPELKATLADLRMTAHALRSLPTLKTPRSFTLTAAQAQGAVQPRPMFPALRFATALAAVALAVVVVGDLSGGLLLNRAAAPAPSSAFEDKAALTVAPPQSDILGASTGAAEVQPTSSPEPEGPIVALAPSTPAASDATSAAVSESLTSTESTSASDATVSQETPAPTGEEALGEETATAVVEAGARTELSATETSAGVAQLIATTPAPTELAAVNQTAVESASSTPQSLIPFIRYIEVGLVTLTLLLGFAAWRIRR
jgi:hypothetical protein